MKRIQYTKEELQEAASRSFSIAGMCRALGLIPEGGNYRTIHRLIKENNLDTSHFTGQLWSKGKTLEDPKYHKTQISLKEILETGRVYQSSKLAKRLILEGYKEHKCEMCGNSEWLSSPISLELHHINGNHDDNHLENLQLLCPNCHATTDTYRGSNRKDTKKTTIREKVFDDDIYTTTNPNPPKVKIRPIRAIPKPNKICKTCGKPFYNTKSTIYCSVECYREDTKGNRPDLIQLLKDFKELKSFVQVGNKYQVSDTAVRKWCKLYGLPILSKEIQIYISTLNI